MSPHKLFWPTETYEDVSRGRTAVADFVSEVLVPVGVCAVALLGLGWRQGSILSGRLWPVLLVVCGAVGILASLAFVGRRRGISMGIWRDLMWRGRAEIDGSPKPGTDSDDQAISGERPFAGFPGCCGTFTCGIGIGGGSRNSRARSTASGMQFVMITVWISCATSGGIWPPDDHPFTRAFASPSQRMFPSIWMRPTTASEA